MYRITINMNKYTVITMVFALALIGVVQNAQIVRAEAEGTIPTAGGSNESEIVAPEAPVTGGANDNESGAIIPGNSGANNNETGAIIPGNGGANANETGAIIPQVDGANGNETGAIIPNAGGANDDEGTLAVTPPVTPPITPPVTPSGGGGSFIGGGSSSSSSSGSSVLLSNTSGVGPTFVIGTCPLITDYLKLGGENNPSQVTKLQAFLKNVEKLNVDVTGIFDAKTENAVKAFQEKYAASILGPWSASQASGFVYITTTKKLNELACASQFTLSAEESAIINSFKNRRDGETSAQVTGSAEVTAPTTGTLEVGTTGTDTDNENVAAVGEASILSRFWNYIKDLFR